MSGSQAGELVNPAVSASKEVDTLLIEKYNGKVNKQYIKGENLQMYFDFQEVVGTNTVSNKYIGETDLQVMSPGQEAEGTPVEYDKNALTVDTAIIARNTVAHIHDVQSDISGNKSMIAENQVSKIKKLEDEMLLQQLAYGALNNTEAERVKPRVKGHGFSILVEIDEDQSKDPNSLLSSIEYALEQQLEQEVDVNDVTCIVSWKEFNTLRDAERITNSDYTTSTGTPVTGGWKLKSYGLPIVPTNRMPKTVTPAGEHHMLSAASNGYRYDITANQIKARALLFQKDALLAGRTIALQADIFWDKKTKCFFIDSWLAEGCIPDRWESCAGVFLGDTENAEVKTRAVRKATSTKTVTA